MEADVDRQVARLQEEIHIVHYQHRETWQLGPDLAQYIQGLCEVHWFGVRAALCSVVLWSGGEGVMVFVEVVLILRTTFESCSSWAAATTVAIFWLIQLEVSARKDQSWASRNSVESDTLDFAVGVDGLGGGVLRPADLGDFGLGVGDLGTGVLGVFDEPGGFLELYDDEMHLHTEP
ncbi:hypothetical protein SUGI_0199740 [Cryptomeria japonica]|nr:hypothetical protein SUGI_0199740 [Cryptomeria japonica]